jgi:hypothetical protein
MMNDQLEISTAPLLAWPTSIRWIEQYEYKYGLDENPDCRPAGTPSGEITIVVPYDGYSSLPRSTASLAGEYRAAGLGEARIGFLALSRAPRSDQMAALAAPEVMSIPLALSDARLATSDKLTADEDECALSVTYEPAAPVTDPLDIDVNVYDDETAPVTRLSEFLALANAQRSPNNSLILDVTLRVHVPSKAIIGEPAQIDAYLDPLSIQWPTVVPNWQLKVVDLSGDQAQPLCWIYNPETESVEVREVRLRAVGAPSGARYIIAAARLRLTVNYPGELTSMNVMQGSARVVLKQLVLSGRQLAVFDAAGYEWPTERLAPVLERQTELMGTFELRLAGRFKRRMTSTYRRLQFPGVMPDALRQADVGAMLRDLGYENIEVHTPQPDEGGWRWRIDCRRWEPVEHALTALTLLAIEGGRGRTRREQAVPGGLTVSTIHPTSSLTLHIWGRLQGGSGSLTNGLNDVLEILKHRFRAVAVFR